jgi:hypothetical protein
MQAPSFKATCQQAGHKQKQIGAPYAIARMRWVLIYVLWMVSGVPCETLNNVGCRYADVVVHRLLMASLGLQPLPESYAQVSSISLLPR